MQSQSKHNALAFIIIANFLFLTISNIVIFLSISFSLVISFLKICHFILTCHFLRFVISFCKSTTLGIYPAQVPIKLSNYLKKRGRYTNKAFWESILVLQKDEHSKIEICNKTARDEGFKNLYTQISQ